jgi:hypothetical protein
VEPPALGQDNSGLAKAVAPYGVAIRSTCNGGGPLERNWPIIKRHVTPARFYGAPVWMEPPYPPGIDPDLIPARLFEAMSCGAVAFHEWVDHLLRHADVYREIAPRATIVHPHTDLAVYFPTLDHWITGGNYPEYFWRIAARLRRFADYDVVDDRLIRDGALEAYRVLVIPQATRMEAEALAILTQWSRAGGVLVKRPEPLVPWPDSPIADCGLQIADCPDPDNPKSAICNLQSEGGVVVAPDLEDESLIACVVEALPPHSVIACDERPVYATRCEEGWLVLNLSEETEKVDVEGRTFRLEPRRFELYPDER